MNIIDLVGINLPMLRGKLGSFFYYGYIISKIKVLKNTTHRSNVLRCPKD